MARPSGGYVTSYVAPQQWSAVGMWSLRDSYNAMRADAWPTKDLLFSSVTVLLHCNGSAGSTSFPDSSPSPKTFTAAGNAAISTTNGRAAFGGASAVFDGTGDYLTSVSNAGWAFGTGDFCIEAWVFRTTINPQQSLMGVGYGVGGIGVFFDSSDRVNVTRPGTAIDHIFTASVPRSAWTHVAVTRQGTNLRCFVDGVQKGTTFANSRSYAQADLVVGMDGDKSTQGYIGYIDEFRITKGAARYVANFTPRQAAFQDA